MASAVELLQPGMARKGSQVMTGCKTPINANQVIAPSIAASNYKKRKVRVGQDVTNAEAKKKDPDQPDTVGFILGLPDYQPKENTTKVQLKHVKERLKKEEKEAWIETTKNLVQNNKIDEPELMALNRIMRVGLKQDDLVDVKVIDRIKDDYLDHVQQKMKENCQDVDAKKLTSQEIQEKKETNEINKIGVKAF